MCVYFKLQADVLLVVGVYVDDLLVTGTEQAAVDAFFGELDTLSIKDLGRAHKFLGMRVVYDDTDGYYLDQEVMITTLLKEHGMEHAHGVRTSIGDDSNKCARKDAGLLKANEYNGAVTISDFQSLVGSLLWLARCTRPDIAFAVHKVTRRTHSPTMDDWKLAKRILRYLAGTRELRLGMQGKADSDEPLEVVAYSDADFAADKEDRKSVTGGLVTLDGMAVAWVCRKQGGVSLSTMEAEYTAASVMGQELLGFRELLNELSVPLVMPMPLRVDNQPALNQLNGEKASSKAKHIDTRIKFIVHFTKTGVLPPDYCEGKSMPADVLTKALPAPRLRELRGIVGLS
ncbi:Integrase catalytic core protein [Phytophthora cinnamomi]|uniref:Integrase catalytic core protein n=1 Tax=Phytophthora cinnamomi TaxID=4785 RepID=UPI00355A4E99|nr:Integrase catalytic core protein [Phytophthora cinnamomi]